MELHVRNLKSRLRKILLYIFFGTGSFVSLYPLYFVIISSFKVNSDIFSTPFTPPRIFILDNYLTAFKTGGVGLQFINSLILSLSSLVVTLILASMVSFAISRLSFKIKNLTRIYFVMGMMVPIQSIIVPLAFTANMLKLRDNYLILILLYAAFYMPMSIFVISSFMSSLPSSLEEAAVIDGCSMYAVFLRIILPLSKPALATVSIFVFMYCWNDLLTPMVFIGKSNLRTVSVGLLNFLGARNSDYGGLLAAVFIALLPPLLIYIFMQENVVKGITSGANK
jgi:raffinose/stachyose/melibiose transport system permease protein